jgi:diguanylate cyclase (GGDEF)-like protein/PAS domain S-box-containing protein
MSIKPDLISLQRQLRASQSMFDTTFHATPIGKAIVDLTGHCTKVNEPLARMLGYAPADLVGVHFSSFTHPDDVEADVDLFESVMRGERDSYQLDKRYLTSTGKTVDVLLSATVVRDEHGSPVQFISEVLDITERKQFRLALQEANAKLRELVVTDHQTGLLNRRGFEEALAMSHEGSVVSVLLIDLDNFKHINDMLGHEAGDVVLAEVGRRLSSRVRQADVVARVGGDEFGVILYAAGRNIAEQVADRIVGELGSPYSIGAVTYPVGASVGVSCSGIRKVDLRHMLAEADKALYEAKRAGRGRWHIAA